MKQTNTNSYAIIDTSLAGTVSPQEALALLPKDAAAVYVTVLGEAGVAYLETALAVRDGGASFAVYAVLPHEEVAVEFPEPLRDRFFGAVEASDGERLLRTAPAPEGDLAVVLEYMVGRCRPLGSGQLAICS